MPSQFFGLNIAYTGLQASNAWLTTTANNIANVETEGYSRQEVKQEAANALRTYTSYGMAGSGVDAKAIEQIRNQFYDLKYWNSNATLGSFEIKETYVKQIEDYFTETDMVEGFGSIYSSMFSGLDEVYKSAGSASTKTQFLFLAGNLAEYFSQMSNNLRKLQEDANLEIKNRVENINTLGAEIASLNKQINTIEVNGITANELRDKRALLIDKLSKIVDVETQEIPIYTEEGGTLESGANRFIVRIAGGQELVNTYRNNTLECVARDYKVNQSDAEGLFDIVWKSAGETLDENGKPVEQSYLEKMSINVPLNIYGRNLSGELKGLIEVRDGNNEEYFHGRVKDSEPYEVDNEGVGTYKLTVDASADYLMDINKCTLDSEPGVIKLSNKNFEYTSWEFEKTTDENGNEVGRYTFYVTENPEALIAKSVAVDAYIGTSVQYQGIPYYQEQMNEWVRQFAKAMNDIETQAMDENGNNAEVLFAAKKKTDDDMWMFGGDTDEFSSSSDSYYQLTASNFIVNKNMMKDVSKFMTNRDPDQGQDQQDILDEMMNVQTDKDKMTFRGCSSKEFLECVLADVALNSSNARTFANNYDNITKSINNQRLSVSGVDNDEEALNLVKFQEAYNLSAKMIQVFTEIYDRLILNTGV